jgi:3-oxoacyl-[acyl-carrier-protein] synthase II
VSTTDRPFGGDRSPLVITGSGLQTASGRGLDPVIADLTAGRSRVAAMRNVDVSDFSVQRGAVIESALECDIEEPPFLRYCRLALEDAISDAGAAGRPLPRVRTGIAVGTTLGLVDQLAEEPAALSFAETRRRLGYEGLVNRLSQSTGLEGPRSVFSLACASGLCATEQAALDVGLDRADAMIVGGADTLGRFMQGGFSSLHAFAPAPEDGGEHADGLVLGEGAAFVVLEPLAAVRARDQACGAALKSQRLVSDGYHLARPDPSGTGMARAVALAMEDAGVGPSDIGAVILTALGSALHQGMLKRALSASLGSRAAEVPLTSHEAAIGHVLAASGVLVLAFAARVISDGEVPRPFRLDALGKAGQGGAAPAAARLREPNVLTLTVGFGGFNGVAVVGRVD